MRVLLQFGSQTRSYREFALRAGAFSGEALIEDRPSHRHSNLLRLCKITRARLTGTCDQQFTCTHWFSEYECRRRPATCGLCKRGRPPSRERPGSCGKTEDAMDISAVACSPNPLTGRYLAFTVLRANKRRVSAARSQQ